MIQNQGNFVFLTTVRTTIQSCNLFRVIIDIELKFYQSLIIFPLLWFSLICKYFLRPIQRASVPIRCRMRY